MDKLKSPLITKSVQLAPKKTYYYYHTFNCSTHTPETRCVLVDERDNKVENKYDKILASCFTCFFVIVIILIIVSSTIKG